MNMFCTDCGELIQRYNDKVRINNMLVHVHCALSFVRRLFPESVQGDQQMNNSEGSYPYAVEARGDANTLMAA